MEFSDDVLEILRAGGWQPQRRVDVSTFESRLRACGFRVSEPASAILSGFFGLRFPPTLPGGELIAFNDNLAPWHPLLVRRLEAAAGDSCCRIAAKACGEIFVTPNSQIIMLDSDWLFIERARDLAQFFAAVSTGRQRELLQTRWLAEDEIPEALQRKTT